MKTFGVIEKLGGRVATVKRLQAAGYSYGYPAINQWCNRSGRISSAGIEALTKVCREDKIRLEIEDFQLTEISEDAA